MNSDLKKRIQTITSNLSNESASWVEEAALINRDLVSHAARRTVKVAKKHDTIDCGDIVSAGTTVDDVQLIANWLRTLLQFWGAIIPVGNNQSSAWSSVAIELSEAFMTIITATSGLVIDDAMFLKFSKVLGFCFSKCNKMCQVFFYLYSY